MVLRRRNDSRLTGSLRWATEANFAGLRRESEAFIVQSSCIVNVKGVNPMRKKIYIVTGANGFLGNNVIRRLEQTGAEIRALVLPNESVRSLEGLNCTIYRGDVTRKDTLDEIFAVDPEAEVYVIHCAAIVYIKSRYNPKVYDVNVNGTKNVAEKVLEHGARMVCVSSVHALKEKPNRGLMREASSFDPEAVKGLYAKTKAEIANDILELTREKGLDACIVQPSGIIGPRDYGNSHLTQLILDFARGRLTACVRGGYDFVDVRDVADGIVQACEKGRKGECYILSNRYVEVKELLDDVSEVRGMKKIRTVLPMWFAKMTAPLSELYYKMRRQTPLYTRYSLYTLTANAHFSNRKAACELGYRNRDFKETIRDTVRWLEQNGRIQRRKRG